MGDDKHQKRERKASNKLTKRFKQTIVREPVVEKITAPPTPPKNAAGASRIDLNVRGR